MSLDMGKEKSRFKFQSSDSVITTLVALSSEPTLRLQLEFQDRLDVERLKLALRSLTLFEPVLSTHLVLSDDPYYSSMNIDDDALVLVTSSEDEYEQCKRQKIDIEKGPLFSCVLFQAQDRDFLLFKIAHEAADGFGVIEAVKFVARKYRQNEAPDATQYTYHELSRSPERLLKQFNFWQYPRLFWLNLKEKLGYFFPAGTMAYPAGDEGVTNPVFYTKSFDAESVDAMRGYARENDVTVNDMLLAAFLRASAAHVGFAGEEALRILMTINLRRYIAGSTIPSSEICNLSAMECVNLKRDLGNNFLDTVTRVSKVTKGKKKAGIGLSFIMDLMLQGKVKFTTLKKMNQSTRDMVMKTENFAMTVTNVGGFDSELFIFDQKPIDLEFFAPFTYAPFWCSAVYEFNGMLKLGGVVNGARLELLKTLYASVDEELSRVI